MQLTVLTPHRRLIENESVDEVSAPGSAGTLDILPNHANLLSQLETGVLRWRQGSAWKSATISTGFIEIFEQTITILADVSELSTEINLDRARAAESRARQRLSEGGLDDENFRKYQLKLERAIARISASA